MAEVPADVVEVNVERVVPGGEGLARLGGPVILVSGGLPGDRLRVRLRPDGARLLRGSLLSVLSPGPARRPEGEVCPRALDGSCGGCDWPAVRLEHHEGLKRELVRDAFRRIGGLGEKEVGPLRWIGSERNYRLRNRLHVDSLGRVGFYAPSSNDVAGLGTCEIVSRHLLARIGKLAEAFAASRTPGELETLEGIDGTPLLGRFRPAFALQAPELLADRLMGPLDGIEVLEPGGRSVASRGPSSLDLVAGGVCFRVSTGSFFQGNRYLLAPFLDEIRRFVQVGGPRAGGRALDLYAGGGFLTRPLVEAGLVTTAVEPDGTSAEDLAANAASWAREGLPRIDVRRGTAEEAARCERGPVELVVVDPPRAGMSPIVRKELLRLAPPSLVMVSCDPATLARDLGALKGHYVVRESTLLDLFPGTHHVETAVLLGRK